MFVWGTHDKLIPVGFRRHVEQWLPSAEHIMLEGCGHVPQVERPEHTERACIRRFFARRRAGQRRPRAPRHRTADARVAESCALRPARERLRPETAVAGTMM